MLCDQLSVCGSVLMDLGGGCFQISTKQLLAVSYQHRTVQKQVQNNNWMSFPTGEFESVLSFGSRSGFAVFFFMD